MVEMRQLNGLDLLYRVAGQMAGGAKPLLATVAVLFEMQRDGLRRHGQGRKQAKAEWDDFSKHDTLLPTG